MRVVSLEDGDWLAALEVLAAVEPEPPLPSSSCWRERAAAASRALELVVVTSRLTAPLARSSLQRAQRGHGVSLVWIDSASFADRPTAVEPELLRLQAVGIPVAVVRRGDDLRAVFGGAAAAAGGR